MLAANLTRLVAAGAVVVFALWFRVEYQATTMEYVQMGSDAGQYSHIASNLLEHGIYSMAKPDVANPSPDSYRSPGYPVMVAFAMWLAGDQPWQHRLFYMQAVLGALSVALTIAIARRWLPFAYAITAGLLVAVWPHMVTLSSNILTETLFGFTLLLSIYLLCKAQSSRQRIWYALAGFSFAAAALTNPAILPFPVLIGAYLLFLKRKYALLFIACTLLFPLAWGARGLMLDADRSASGRLLENVLVGMDPDFSYLDTSEAVKARLRFHEEFARFQQDPLGGTKMILDRFADKPGFYAKWYFLQKPAQLWQWSIIQGVGDIYVYPVMFPAFKIQPFFRLIASICYSLNVWLFAAAICSALVLATRVVRGSLQDKDATQVLVALVFVYATALYMILAPDPRYAAPFRPFEILMAVSFVALAHQYWNAKKAERELQDAKSVTVLKG